MSIKNSAAIIVILAVATGALATSFSEFTSWDDLTRLSPNIVIARCTTTANPQWIVNGIIESDIEVLSVLKGDTKPGPSRMASSRWPMQGNRFLMFGWYAPFYNSNQLQYSYSAIESYRLVPINRDFPLTDLTGKKLEDQIQIVLSNRLVDVNREMERCTEEKKLLEKGYHPTDPTMPIITNAPGYQIPIIDFQSSLSNFAVRSAALTNSADIPTNSAQRAEPNP